MKRLNSMDTIEQTRHELNRLMRSYLQEHIDGTTFRNLTYAFSILLSFHKAEADQEIEKRLDAIEERINNETFNKN